MTRHIPPIMTRGRWKKPGEKYWQECVVISTSIGGIPRFMGVR